MIIHPSPAKLSLTTNLLKLTVRLFLWSSLLLFASRLSGQKDYPRVERWETSTRHFSASVGEEAVDFFLRFHNPSNYHRAIYSVRGYYSPKDRKGQQELVGLCGLNQLWLFALNDSAQKHSFLSFEFPSKHYWEDLAHVNTLTGFKEKWLFSDSSCYRVHRSRKEAVICEEKDFWVQKTEEYLILSAQDSFLLQELAPWTWNAKVLSTHEDCILLQYQYTSHAHAMGQCGAGEEAGYLLLSFSKQRQLREWKNYSYSSCNEGIYTEEDGNPSPPSTLSHRLYHQCTDETWLLQLDLKQCLVERKLITPKNP